MLAENTDRARRRISAGIHAYIVHRAAHPLWTPLRSWDQLLDWSDGAVALDEVQGVASAREHLGLPYQAANYLRKLRHYDVPLLWTAPDWMAADAVIRRVTRAVTVCRGRLGQDHYKRCRFCGRVHRRADETCDRHSARRLWRDNRLFAWTTYDAMNFDEWTQGKRKQEKPICRQVYWRPGQQVEKSYDTYAEVLSLGAADQAGVCIACGGVKKRKPCRCEDTESPAGIGVKDFIRQGGARSP